jgi:hypothetical protein
VSGTRVHVLVAVMSEEALTMAAMAQAGQAFDWLAGEPDLYTDADLTPQTGYGFAFGMFSVWARLQ